MLREVVPLVLSPSSDLDPAREARLLARMLEVEKMIDGLQGVIDLEAIFPNGKEPGSPGCAGQAREPVTALR